MIHLQGFQNIAIAGLEILGKLSGSGIDALRRIIRIGDAQGLLRLRHELRKTLSASRRDGRWISSALSVHQTRKQATWKAVFSLCLGDQVAVITCHPSNSESSIGCRGSC